MPAGDRAVTVPAFRQVMSRLAGGVTVVATVDDSGVAHGMTVNALTSVSLEPLLVLFCCEQDASLHAPLVASGRWTVSMLTAQQEQLSRWFATRERRGTDQFAGLATTVGTHTGVPLLTDALAWLECRTWATYDGGDHTIVVGEVLDLGFGAGEADPLLYYASEYRTLR